MLMKSLAAFCLVAVVSIHTPALAADTKPKEQTSVTTTPTTTPIDARMQKLFTDMEAVWASRDFKKMRGFWVKDLAAPMYLPEEKKDFITTWAGFDAYFANAAAGSRGGIVTYQPLFSMPIADKQHMVAFELEWTTHLKNEDAPIGGSVRGVAVVQDDGTEWKLKSYIEAPLAPIMYMRDLYKLVAKERGFKAVE